VVRITWLRPEERLEHELRQLREEGVDGSGIVAAWAAARAGDPADLRTRALELLDGATALTTLRPMERPPAEVGEAAGASPPLPRQVLADRLLGAWTGRLAGCLLGKPVEKVPREGIREILQSVGEWPLRRYFTAEGVPPEVTERWPWNRASRPTSLRENMAGMPEDDDVNYTMLALHVLETYGDGFTTDDVATVWLQMLPPLTVFTAERVAMENLLAYVEPPATASYRNPYREWIGAQIRADLWGYVRPGDPAAAAELAWRDARLSHVGNGVYGAMWAAAMVAAAFVESDPARVVARGLDVIPRASRLAEAVAWSAELAAGNDDWEAVLDGLHGRYGHYHWVHAVNNAALVAAALVHGRGAFDRSIAAAVMGGWDTDSNGATVGSVVGAMVGRAGIGDAWAAPLCGEVRSSLKGFDRSRVDDLARRTLACVPARHIVAAAAAGGV
jgi:ADP-ribosylglycohydrolase